MRNILKNLAFNGIIKRYHYKEKSKIKQVFYNILLLIQKIVKNKKEVYEHINIKKVGVVYGNIFR